MAKEDEKPTAADKGKGKEKLTNGDAEVKEPKRDKDGKIIEEDRLLPEGTLEPGASRLDSMRWITRSCRADS